ncbi:gamma-glutamylcyclotransferase [Croceicoccus sp. Ery5]|uniref:gamma-glutamylcyclotransferase family protein n=1 Tax=Croceicoccus sp. Ery5 TaxID=1703340 RepID=UPI001E3ECAEF|nr:gamma-glutamylcyclotransferase family protein [Croceicoccus sp. Ery5]
MRSRLWPAITIIRESGTIVQRLFVYGTLLAATETPMARWLTPRLGLCRDATVAGRLIAVPARSGFYPALLPTSGHRRVCGMVCDAALAPQDWRKLDLYEGGEYQRVPVMVLSGGIWRRAQTYRWAAPVPPAARNIAGGDFRQWLRESRRPAYTGG